MPHFSKIAILALDFDGVISDSILECLVTAYNAFSKYRGLSEFRTDLEEFSKTELATFRGLRSFIRRGEDYVFLLQAMSEGISLSSQKQFDRYLAQNIQLTQTYRDLFYGQREQLQNQYPSDWLMLNPLYPGMADFLNHLTDSANVYIVTTKDLKSVELILASNTINFRRENMFQATRTYRKPQVLQEIMQKRGISSQQVHFIDDHVATVMEVSENTDVNCSCADWGYNTPEQQAELAGSNISIDSISDFFKRFT